LLYFGDCYDQSGVVIEHNEDGSISQIRVYDGYMSQNYSMVTAEHWEERWSRNFYLNSYGAGSTTMEQYYIDNLESSDSCGYGFIDLCFFPGDATSNFYAPNVVDAWLNFQIGNAYDWPEGTSSQLIISGSCSTHHMEGCTAELYKSSAELYKSSE